MKKTIGSMIKELEDMNIACRKAEKVIGFWESLFRIAPPDQKARILRETLVSVGLSEKDAKDMVINF